MEGEGKDGGPRGEGEKGKRNLTSFLKVVTYDNTYRCPLTCSMSMPKVMITGLTAVQNLALPVYNNVANTQRHGLVDQKFDTFGNHLSHHGNYTN